MGWFRKPDRTSAVDTLRARAGELERMVDQITNEGASRQLISLPHGALFALAQILEELPPDHRAVKNHGNGVDCLRATVAEWKRRQGY